MSMRKAWPALLVAALLGLAACNSQPATGEAPPAGSQPGANNPGQPQEKGGSRGRPNAGERMKPLADQFKEAREHASSEFERGVYDRAISAGAITAADYEEAFSRYRQCAEDAKIAERYTRQPDGFYKIDPPANLTDIDRYLKVTGDCAKNAGLASIEALYRTQVDNPELLADPKLVVVQCLVKAGLVDPGYTPEKLMAFVEGGFAGKDFDPRGPEAQRCFTAGGMAINIAPRNGGA